MSLMFHNARTCMVICTPLAKVTGPRGDLIYDPISPLWHKARHGLHMPTNFNTTEMSADGLEVGDARSRVAVACLNMTPVPEFLFFIDSDVIVPHDALTKLFFRARCRPDHDIFAGVYCLKNPSVPDPLIYGENGQGPLWDWAVGDILTTDTHGVASVHMGLTLIRVSLFQKIKDAGLVGGDGADQGSEPFFCTQNFRNDTATATRLQVGTEDIYFCAKARKAGAKILVDTGVLAGHHDKATGVSYGLPWEDGPWKRGKWLPGSTPDRVPQDVKECEADGLKLALDIGAGGTRREWPGHKTYTTDIRPDTEPDYVQDTRLLNLPGDHYDLTASSHHLEHLGRWDQEKAWAELFRVTKPGGECEHVVPNLAWAAEKITSGEVDAHVFNVLYGAQELHGYAREFNTHYFGYTPAIGKALAEAAGFVDVTTEGWKDREELGYNLIIRGRKPLPDEAPKEQASEAPTEAAPVAQEESPPDLFPPLPPPAEADVRESAVTGGAA